MFHSSEQCNISLHGLEFTIVIHRNHDDDKFRLVTKDGRTISTIHATFIPKPRKIVCVMGFNVLPEYRSIGFGSKLFRFILKYYGKKGYTHITLADGSKFSGTRRSIYYRFGMRKNLRVWAGKTNMYGNIRHMVYGVRYKPFRRINGILDLIYPSRPRTRSIKRREGGWDLF